MMLRPLSWLVVAGLLVSAVPASAAEGDKYLPGSTQAVLMLNVKQMLESPLVKKELPKIQEGLKASPDAQVTLNALGFDPLKDLESVVIAAAGADDQDQVMILARGKFDMAKFKAMADKMAKEQKDTLKVHQVGGNTIYEATVQGQPKPFFVALVDGNTMVASMKKTDVSDVFDIKAGKKAGTVKKELQGLLDKASPKQSLSVIALGGALGGGIPFGDKVEHINGGVTLGDDIQTEFVITTKDADSAKGIAELLRQGLEQGKQFVALFAQQQKELAPLAEIIDVLKVNTKDNTVSIKGQVTKETVDKLKKN